MNKIDQHDLLDFIRRSQSELQNEYERISRNVISDPGTAGDQGEENWKMLLESWLPKFFTIVTKGRIIAQNGYLSPQLDLLVLNSAYPPLLAQKSKTYLAGGVVAAFECKTTLRSSHFQKSLETSAELRRQLQVRKGTPYKELNSPIIYGVLAHSHEWKKESSKPSKNISNNLSKAHDLFVKHPRECLDFLTVADVGNWKCVKNAYSNSDFDGGCCITSYMEHTIANKAQVSRFTPIGSLLTGLYTRLAWDFPEVRPLAADFRRIATHGNGNGKPKKYRLEDTYSDEVLPTLKSLRHTNSDDYNECSKLFFAF